MNRRAAVAIGAAVGLPGLIAAGLFAFLAIPHPVSFLRGDRVQTTVVRDRNGEVLREVRSARYGVAHWVELERMSPWLARAAVASEDKRFYRHPGIDLLAVGRAALTNARARKVLSGASTITQQLVRNLYSARDRGLWVKLAEALEALRLERHYSKQEILEAYLNRVCFGNQAYGAEAAAELYFDRAAAELSLGQSCFLVAIPRSPAGYEPFRNYGATLRRQRRLLDRMFADRTITRLEYEVARAETIRLAQARSGYRAPHFVDMVLAGLNGGRCRATEVVTTLDLQAQQGCEEMLTGQLERLAQNHVTNGAVVVLDRKSGDVLAMVGSQNYFGHEAGQVNACLSLRQPGSAIKPFVYAAAFEWGMGPGTILPDIPLHFTEAYGDYRPSNFDRRFHGPVSARTALGSSYNVPAVVVAEKVGPERLLEKLKRAGITSLEHDAAHYGLALGLGAGDVRLLELANAYRMLANGGEYTPCRTVCRVRGPDGRARFVDRPEPSRAFDATAAFLVTDILADNRARAPGFGEFSSLCLPFPCAAKTGTSKDFRDNWTLGYTSEYVVGVWVGNFDGSPMHRVSGISGSGPLFRDIMLMLHRSDPAPLPVPDGLARCEICPESGKRRGRFCPNGVSELFDARAVPSGTCDVHRAVLVDRKSGEPATGTADPENVVEQVFEYREPTYWPWMEANGIELPPMADLQPGSGRVAVLFPDRGDVFKLDPDVARERQCILLKAGVRPGTSRVVWEMDGQELGTAERPYTLFWQLEPGRHRVRVRSGDRASGEVSFLVLP